MGNFASRRKYTPSEDCQIKRIYTEEQRIQVCRMLRDCNNDFNKVAKETGIKPSTIRVWAVRYKDRNLDERTSLIAQRVEWDLSKMKIDFISKNYEKMDKLAEAAINRALALIPEEEDLNKVNNTIRILTDFFAKMKNSDQDESNIPGSAATINLIQQSIQYLNVQNENKKKESSE